jgi:hypothetical protein
MTPMTAKLTRHEGPFVIDTKRFHLPYTLTVECPECGVTVKHNMAEDHYLGYPTAGVTFDHSLCCNNCYHEWAVPMHLDFMLTVVEDSDATSS